MKQRVRDTVMKYITAYGFGVELQQSILISCNVCKIMIFNELYLRKLMGLHHYLRHWITGSITHISGSRYPCSNNDNKSN